MCKNRLWSYTEDGLDLVGYNLHLHCKNGLSFQHVVEVLEIGEERRDTLTRAITMISSRNLHPTAQRLVVCATIRQDLTGAVADILQRLGICITTQRSW